MKFLINNFYLYYFYIYFKNCLFNLLNFLNIKRNIIYIFLISSFYLHYIICFFFYNSLIKILSLIDIIIIDLPKKFFRFEIIYVFWSNLFNLKFFLKIFINLLIPVLSLKNFFNSCLWLEREIWDMYGIRFLSHNDLRRILTDYNFLGFPLRKDYPLLGYLELRYDDTKHILLYEFIEIMQDFRIFKFINPWNRWY